MSKIRTDFETDSFTNDKNQKPRISPQRLLSLANSTQRHHSPNITNLAEAQLAAAITPWTPRERPIENTSE